MITSKRLRVLFSALCAASLALTLCAVPPPASAAPAVPSSSQLPLRSTRLPVELAGLPKTTAGYSYELNYDGRCLTADPDFYGTDGDNVQLQECDGISEQYWQLDDVSGGISIIKNENGQCLDAKSEEYPSDGDNVQLWGCYPSHPEQGWVPVAASSWVHNSMLAWCLDADETTYDDPVTNVQLWQCKSNVRQYWYGL